MSFDYTTYSLKEHFDEFNARYWNGDLPSGPLCWIKDAKDMVVGAHAQFDINVSKTNPHSLCWRIKILIPTAESEGCVNGLLLHEMIHLQLKDEPTEQSSNSHFHGEKFKAKAAELKQLTGYRNIEDVDARTEDMRSFFHELMKRQDG